MMGIVLIHAFGHGSKQNIDWIYSLGETWSSSYHLSLFALGKVGVTGFMFISGYYGVKFNLKKIIELLIMLLVYATIVELIEGNGLYSIFMNVFHPWEGWWFVKCYLFICFISPLLNKGISLLSKKEFQIIIILLILYQYLGNFLLRSNSHDTEFLLTVFLIARYLKLYPLPYINDRSLIVCISVLTLVLFFFPILIIRLTHSSKLLSIFLQNNCIVILLFTASLVILLDRKAFNCGFVNWLCSSTLAIYLITDSGLREVFDPWLLSKIISSPIIGYGLLILICISCLFIDKVRGFICKPIVSLLDRRCQRVQ